MLRLNLHNSIVFLLHWVFFAVFPYAYCNFPCCNFNVIFLWNCTFFSFLISESASSPISNNFCIYGHRLRLEITIINLLFLRHLEHCSWYDLLFYYTEPFFLYRKREYPFGSWYFHHLAFSCRYKDFNRYNYHMFPVPLKKQKLVTFILLHYTVKYLISIYIYLNYHQQYFIYFWLDYWCSKTI